MAFSFVAAGTHYDSASSTSAVVPVPAGTAENDILFALVKYGSSFGPAPTGPGSGWVSIADDTDGNSGSNWSVWWKLAVASEAADYTWTSTSGRTGGIMYAFRDGFDTADAIDVVSADANYFTNDTTNRASGITVAAANSPLIFFGMGHGSSALTQTVPTNPTTFTEHNDSYGANSRFWRQCASVIWSGSGATGNIDSTISSSTIEKVSFAVALNPAAAGASNAPRARFYEMMRTA